MFFKKRKKEEFVDLGSIYKKQKERAENIKESLNSFQNAPAQPPSGGITSAFGNFFGSSFNSSTNTEATSTSNLSDEERKKKLAKRLMDITNKIEDLSNQIYHLTQRLDLIEKKIKVGY